jgi:hypothetical protein
MPALLRLSWGMKTLKLFLLPVLESFEFTWQVIHYALIFVSAFFRQRASLGCSIEEEVKRKNLSPRWSFSCFQPDVLEEGRF